jgi:hypothetical protein
MTAPPSKPNSGLPPALPWFGGIAATVAVAVLLWSVFELPSQHQRARSVRVRLAELDRLIGLESELRDTLRAWQGSSGREARISAGRTVAAVSADLQAVLQEYADGAALSLQSLDASGETRSDEQLQWLPLAVSARGDIYGVVDFLDQLQRGERLMVVRAMEIVPNPALRGELLQLTLRIEAPYVLEP